MFEFFKSKRIYLDYAGATPVSARALRTYQKANTLYGNPSALHHEGVAARAALEEARKDIARVMECRSSHVVFTSGATEANNILIRGVLGHCGNVGHAITTTIEHASILEPYAVLEEEGVSVSYLEPDGNGIISAESLKSALRKDTVLISIGWANSEIGVVQQVGALARIIRAHEKEHGTKVVFHADAGQAPLYSAATMVGLGVDALTLDSGKLYGPRGIGALIVNDSEIKPLLYGGGQEGGLRPGTESVALAVGFAAALTEDAQMREKETRRVLFLRNMLQKEITRMFPGSVINGSTEKMLPHIVNVSIPDIDPEYVVMRMDALLVAIATKSACEEGERVSHVVYALDPEHAWRSQTTLRFSLGRGTKTAHITRACKALSLAATDASHPMLGCEHDEVAHHH